MQGGKCSPWQINQNIETKMFTITNSMLEVATVISEYGQNGWTEEVAEYEGGRVGHAIGTIVRETLGIERL